MRIGNLSFHTKYVLKICIVMFGTWISSIGIIIFVNTGLGADPISTFLIGVIRYIPIAFGTASQIFNILILLLLFLMDRHLIGLGSVLNAFFVGFFINQFSSLVLNVEHGLWLPVKVFLGPLLLGIGTGIYLSAKLGSGALESMMLFISEKWKFSIKKARIILDFTLVVLGAILGAPIGFGTVIGIFLIGPIIEGTLRLIQYYRKKNRTV